MMKRLLFIIGLFVSLYSFGQTPTGYTKFNQKYNFIEVRADSALGFPVRDTFIAPAYIGESRYKTSDSTVYIAIRISGAGKKWQAVGGGTSHTEGYGIDITTGIISVDSSLLLTRLDNYRLLDSISGSINPTLQEVLTNGSTLTSGASIDAGLNEFTVTNAGIMNLYAAYEYVLNISDGSNTSGMSGTADDLTIVVSNSTTASSIFLTRDSIKLRPQQGQLNIDSLRSWSDIADTAYKKPMTWDTRNGRWEYFNSWPSQNYLALDDIADTLENYGWETDTLTGLFVTEGSPDTLRIDTTDIATRAWVLAQGYGGGAYTAGYGLILSGSEFSVDTAWNKIATKAYVDSAVMGGGSSVTFGTTTQLPYMNAGGTDFIYSASLTFDGTNLSSSDVTAADDVFVGDDLVFNSTGDLIDFNSDIQIVYSATNTLKFQNATIYYFDNDILPFSNNIVPLGSFDRQFSELRLGEGAFIDWDNNDVRLTQTADSLILTGGELIVPYEAYGSSWQFVNETPTKKAMYGQIELIHTAILDSLSDHHTRILAAGGGGSVTYGTDNQIPVMNAAGTAFEYSAGLAYTGSLLDVDGGLALVQGTITTDVPLLDLTSTWNDAGVTFNAIKANITATASASASALMDLQVGGTSMFKVRKDGFTTIANDFAFGPATGWQGIILYYTTAGSSTGINALGTLMPSTGAYQWGNNVNVNIATADLFLYRDATGILAQRNGTNTQEFRLYNTDNGANDEYLSLGWQANANTLTFETEATGTGTIRDFKFSGGNVTIDEDLTISSLASASDKIVWSNTSGTLSYGSVGEGLENNGTALSSKSYSLTTNTTDVGNVGSGEDNLMTYSLGAGTLASDGDYIEFTMTLQTAVNANAKTIKVYFGSTTLLSLPSLSSAGGYITITGKIIRTGATTQDVEISYVSTNDNQTASFGTAAETLSGALTLKATGEGVSDNDITMKLLTVKYFSN